MSDNFRLVGHTRLRNNKGEALENHVKIEVENGVSRASADAPRPRPGRVPVESDSPDVERFLQRWQRDIHETARYVENLARPPLADPKPKDLAPVVDLPDHMMVACPSCNGAGDFMCALCDGDGCVTKRRAFGWRESRP